MDRIDDVAKKKISVAVDTTFMDGRVGMGTAVFIREFLEHLDAPDLDITLIHREPAPDDPLYRKFKEVIIPRVPLPRGSRRVSELLFFLTTRKRYDVYFFAYNKLQLYFPFAPGKRIVSMQYDGGPDTAGYDVGPFTVRLTPFLAFLACHFADAFIATSEFGKRGLVKVRGLPAEKIHVVYGGAADIFRPIPKENAWALLETEYGFKKGPLIVASGRLDPHKNILRMIEAFDILKKRYKLPHRLIVTGGAHMPEYSRQVFDLIKKKGLENDVTILHVRHFKEMPHFYCAADAFIFPSLYEGFGLPLAEAMRCGVPTIVSRSSSLAEVGSGASAFFDPSDAENMACVIAEVLMDVHKQHALSRAGLERAKLFTWEKYAQQMADIISSIAQS
jgi:glycosyltransferase involved in cell wall biosynthesis